jgi:hypothetical protein
MLLFSRGGVAQVGHGQRVVGHGQRDGARAGGVAGAQHRVALEDAVDGDAEQRGLEIAFDAHGAGDVIEMAVGASRVQLPQVLLVQRQLVERTGGQWRQPGGLAAGQEGGLAGHGGQLEERTQRQRAPERGLDAGGQLCGQQGVAAEGEEVVGAPHPIATQHLAPQLRQLLFQRRIHERIG